MGKKKSKARAASSTSASVKVPAVSEATIIGACLARDVEKLSQWGRRDVRVTTGQPLCLAAEEGFVSVVRCLVKDLGANINRRLDDGSTPLIIAVRNGHLE
jgi:hypothetical protein